MDATMLFPLQMAKRAFCSWNLFRNDRRRPIVDGSKKKALPSEALFQSEGGGNEEGGNDLWKTRNYSEGRTVT
jgi:hypothetical protein